MARIKGAVATRKRRKKILKLAKGYWGSKSRHFKMAKQALMKSGNYAFAGRKARKRDFRRLWITRISAGCRANGLSYSKFMKSMRRIWRACCRARGRHFWWNRRSPRCWQTRAQARASIAFAPCRRAHRAVPRHLLHSPPQAPASRWSGFRTRPISGPFCAQRRRWASAACCFVGRAVTHFRQRPCAAAWALLSGCN